MASGSTPCGAAEIDALGEPAHFRLQRLDGAARHRFQQAVRNLRQVGAKLLQRAAEIGHRLTQGLDLRRQIADLGFQARQIRAGRKALRLGIGGLIRIAGRQRRRIMLLSRMRRRIGV